MNGTARRSLQVMAVSTFVVLISGFILAALSTGAQAQSSFRFVSWADTKSAKDDLSILSNQAFQLNPAFTIYPGDLEDSGFTQSGMDEWKQAMNGQYPSGPTSNGMFDIVFPVRGNHDDSNTAGWQTYFDFQATANLVGATHYTDMPLEEDLTYSFDYENAHFIGVDVTGSASGISSSQITWIDADLTAAEARGLAHAFIYFHGPIYCVDGHCSCSQRTCSIDTDVENLIEVLNQHPIVSATFHGHEHTYAHTYIDETRIPPDGAFEGVTHPFHQFVTGSAGAGPSSCNPSLRCDYNMPEQGFVTVDVDGPNVTVTFYQQGIMDPVNTISFSNEAGGTPIPPTANDDSATTAQGTPVTIDVAYNDTDPNGNLDPGSAIEIGAPSNGTLVNNGDGTFDYTPDAGFTGADSFVYEICDTDPLCDTATASITVTPPNDPPMANDDPSSTTEDTPVIIDVTTNDSDPDGNLDPASANSSCANGSSGCLGAANGSLSDNGDGTITYTPNADFNGTDSFVYEICDTYGLCDTATVTITVDAVADPPVANDDPASATEDTPVTIDVAANDSDPDGNLDPTTANTNCGACAEPVNGLLVNNVDGTFDYTPDPGFIGLDSFVYEICDTDATCDTASVNITVNTSAPNIFEVRVAASSDDAEEQASGSVGLSSSDLELILESSEQTVGMRFNAVDIPQGAAIASAYVQFQVDETTDVATSLSIQGQNVDNASTFTSASWNISSRLRTEASVPWVPAPWPTVGEAGPDQQTPDIAAVVHEIVNRSGWASGNSLVIIITGSGKRVAESYNGVSAAAPLLHVEYTTGPAVNQPPVANNDSASTPEDTSVAIDVAANDSDPEGSLDLASVNTGCPTCVQPDNGSLLNNGDGTFTYTPNSGFNGPDSFVYQICDTLGTCDTATVTITVTLPNDPPVANDDSATTDEDSSVTIDVTANDSDTDGNLDSDSVSVIAGPNSGMVLKNGGGNFTYTPNPDFNGSDSFIYQICDTLGLCDTATVSITVDAVNDPPVANADSATTVENTSVIIDIAANDSDPDGNLDPNSANETGAPSNGTLVNNGDGSCTYTPDMGFTGPDSFTYQICDTDLMCDTASVSITVTLSAPAIDIADTVSSGTTTGSSITISHTTSGSERLMLVGVSINNDNFETVSAITYNGVSLTYVNSETQSDDARVEIWKLVDPPTGTNNVVITFSADLIRYAVAGVITFTGVDQTDPLGTFAGNNATSNSANVTVPSASGELVLGVFSCETCNSVTFSLPADEQWNFIAGNGNEIGSGSTIESASPQVTINASLGTSDHWALGGVSIRPSSSGTPTPTNDPPVANDDSASTPEDAPVTIDVAANDSDPDGNLDPTSANTTCGTCAGPLNGTLANHGDGTFTYSPESAFTGSDSFVYEICDTGALCDTATVSITVSTASIIRVPEDQPSIQAAINAAQNGDVILVSPGTYNESLTLNKAITLTSLYFTTGDEAYIASTILDGSGGSSVVDIPAGTPDRPTIMGVTIQNATDGVFPYAKFDFLHNIVRDTSDGIDYESGSGGLCQFNVFEMNSDDGIDLDGSVDIVIADNIIRNNGDDGIEIRMQAYSGPTLNYIIKRNEIYSNDEDGIQVIDYSDLSDRFLLIERNLIKDNAMAGLGLMDNGDTTEDYRAASIPERIHVFNNTFIGNNHGLTGGDNLIALNNLFVNCANFAMKNVDGSSIAAYNLFWNNGTDEQGSNLDLDNTLYADPLLDADSHLLSGSPAIDAGISFFQWQGETVLDIPDTEFNGADPDLGMYESDFGPPVNDAPLFTSTAVTTATEDVAYSYAITTSDPDVGDTLAISATTLPSWLSLVDNADGTATLNGTPTAAVVGDHPVFLQVTDAGGLSDTQSFTITVSSSGDVVTITKAEFKQVKQELRVIAISSEQPNAVLTVEGIGEMVFKNNRYELKVRQVSSPGTVTVTSDLGGSTMATVVVK